MKSPIVVTLATAMTLIALGLCGVWIWMRVTGLGWVRPAAPATPSAVPTVTPTATPTPAQVPPGYRLAGIAVGVTSDYAVIEAPGGRSSLYRVSDDVPGLGRIVSVEPDRVVLDGAAGRFVLKVAPAPVPTRTPVSSPEVRRTTPTPPLDDE